MGYNRAMRKPDTSSTDSPASLKVQSVSADAVTLRGAHHSVRLTALAPNLFRLRIVRGVRFSTRPSWAVVERDWSTDAKVRTNRRFTTISTGEAELRIEHHNGAWRFRDAEGRTLLQSAAGQTGFSRKSGFVRVALQPEDRLHGLGETTGSFDKRGLVREFWNTDVLGHAPCMHPAMRSIYVSIPFGIVRRGRAACGLFWDNPARQTWDLGQTDRDLWQMTAASGEIDLYLFAGPDVPAVTRSFTELTGAMSLPPVWALGYHQCRYSYETRAEVERVARTMRRKKIPCDVLYFDIHHMDNYRVFTFGKTYPKPAELIANLEKLDFKVVTIVDPGVKDDPKFGVLKRGKALDAFVKDRGGKRDFIGKVWPGRSRFPDFLRADVRQWWGREQRRLSAKGVAGFWNDMNEPANFALPSKTLDEGAVHRTDQGRMSHAEAHNVYGSQMARASYEGALAASPDRRPFIITRAAHPGIQRHAMVWTGDNSSTWEDMAASIPMMLNLSLSGVPFCGCDAGGFVGNATPELFQRWMQLAAFTPFFRGHTDFKTLPHEPWSFGAEVEAAVRKYNGLRYSLLPYFYGLFRQASLDGTPIMRPMFWHYPDDERADRCADQFLLGPDLLVAPILTAGAVARMVYLPAGKWYDFHTGEVRPGGRNVVVETGREIPLFVRAGAILPRVDPGEQVMRMRQRGHVTLEIYAGGDGELEWYEDDGESFEYRNNGSSRRRVRFTSRGSGDRLKLDRVVGEFASLHRNWRLVLRGVAKQPGVRVDGRSHACEFDRATATAVLTVPNRTEPLEITWRGGGGR